MGCILKISVVIESVLFCQFVLNMETVNYLKVYSSSVMTLILLDDILVNVLHWFAKNNVGMVAAQITLEW